MKTIFFVLTLSLSFNAYAKRVLLFDSRGQQVPDYEKQLESLENGDELIFDNGKSTFIFHEKINNGKTTQILKVAPISGCWLCPSTVALRIPLKSGKTAYNEFRHETPFVNYIDYFVKGMKKLNFAGIRTPKVYKSKSHQFAAVEYVEDIQNSFTLNDFLKEGFNIDSSTKEKALNALYKFAEPMSAFSNVGDFGAVQMVYDRSKDEWILLDTIQTHYLYPSDRPHKFRNPMWFLFYPETNASDSHKKWLNELDVKIEDILESRRKSLLFYPQQCQFLLRFLTVDRLGI